MSNEPKDFSDKNPDEKGEMSDSKDEMNLPGSDGVDQPESATESEQASESMAASTSDGDDVKPEGAEQNADDAAGAEETPASTEGGAEVAMAVPPANTEQSAPADAGKQKSGGKGLSILALLIALIALILVSGLTWLAWQEYQKQQSQAQSVQGQEQKLESELADMRQDIQALAGLRAELMNELRRETARQQATLDQAQRALDRRVQQATQQAQQVRQQLQSMGQTDRRDWLLAETEYLMRLANQRLLMSRDVESAAELLSAADQILMELDDPALHDVRAKLADEMADLSTAARFDTEGLYLKIGGLAKQADKLRLSEMPAYEVEPVVDESAEGDWQAKIESGLSRAWDKLSSYIRLQNRGEKHQALLAPEQETALRYSVRLMYEQAQFALLASEQQLYERSLGRAAQWLRRYFTLDESAERLAAQTEALAEQRIELETPDISGSLRALKLYMDNLYFKENAARGRQP